MYHKLHGTDYKLIINNLTFYHLLTFTSLSKEHFIFKAKLKKLALLKQTFL